MKAVLIDRNGGPEVVNWKTVQTPEPGPDQVLVRIKAASMNHLDLWVRAGFPGLRLPIILGSDGAGVIESLGSRVKKFSVGDKVVIQPLTFCGKCSHCLAGRENYCDKWGILGENSNGTQCELMAVDADHLYPLPSNLSFLEAAAFPLTAMTAFAMLVNRANIKAHETVFVWGAGSGVGSMAIQIAKAKGCLVIAAAGNLKKINLGKKLGADLVLNYHDPGLVDSVLDFTEGKGVNAVIEHVGQKTWDKSLKILGLGGRLVTCGATTGPKVNLDLRHLFYKQQSIMGSTMGNVAAFESCLDLVRQEKIKPVVDRKFKMSEIQTAHAYLGGSRQAGKVLLLPE
ncbi:MAG: zinc-binding dehydrogenase [Candidatus Neomarinimicrobiota bacterium]